MHDIAFLALWKFAESLRRVRGKKWEAKGTEYEALNNKRGGNFPRHYTVRAANKEVADEVRRLAERLQVALPGRRFAWALRRCRGFIFPAIYISRCLWKENRRKMAPLFRATRSGTRKLSFPPPLNGGERNFVESLRIHLKENGVPEGEYFLLRNLSRGKGVGFFTDAGFYPDFILWIKRGDGQRIVFIEPHGLLLDKHPDYNPKVGLHELLAKTSDDLAQTTPEWENVRMDSFVISQTDAEKLQERWGKDWTEEKCADKHILFPQEDHGHIARILKDED